MKNPINLQKTEDAVTELLQKLLDSSTENEESMVQQALVIFGLPDLRACVRDDMTFYCTPGSHQFGSSLSLPNVHIGIEAVLSSEVEKLSKLLEFVSTDAGLNRVRLAWLSRELSKSITPANEPYIPEQVDPASISAYLNSKAGERVIVNAIKSSGKVDGGAQ